MYPIPGVWIIASLVGAVGLAMQARWVLTRTESAQARSRGIVRAALVESVGLIALVLTTQGKALIAGLVIMLGLGTLVGVVAARALRPPP